MEKPNWELKAFAKTGLLQPGTKQKLQWVIEGKDLASFNTKTSSWVAEKGKYTIKAAASSLNTRKKAFIELPKEWVIEKCFKVLSPQVEINELKN